MNLDLFDEHLADVPIAPGAVWLRGFARDVEDALAAALRDITSAAPFRHMLTPGRRRMSVAMTNCGTFGWTSSPAGYSYERCDPETGRPWPPLPEAFASLAARAADRGGFLGFVPDACLVNRYEPGTQLSLHQDKDEADFTAPIVSVSLGLPATFVFGGFQRSDKGKRLGLVHGDVVVWGGPARLRFHAVLPVKEGTHPFAGRCRINLTFRRAR